MKIRYQIVVIILCLILASCGINKKITLVDISKIKLPDYVTQISDEDMSAAIQIQIDDKQALIIKDDNNAIVEDGDVVTIKLNPAYENSDILIIEIGYDEIKGIDEALLNKHLHNTFDFKIDAKLYTMEIIKISYYADKITDEIAKQYFSCNTSEEAIDAIRKDIVYHRAFDYAYEVLISSSKVTGYDNEINEYAEGVFHRLSEHLKEDNTDIDDYVHDVYDADTEAYKQALKNVYREYLILGEFFRQENIDFSDEQVKRYLEICADMFEESESVFQEIFGIEYIYYLMYYDASVDVIVEKFGVN